MREDYLIAMANLVNGSLLGYEDRSRVPEYEKTVDDYVDSLEDKNQKYKEVIHKAIEYVSNKKAIINTDVIRIFDLFEIDEQGYTDKLLDILKGVNND